MPTLVAFRGYQSYVDRIAELAVACASVGLEDRSVRAELNGQAAVELRARVGLGARRSAGTFFTGHEMAERLVSQVPSRPPYWDPACGAGDLLLAAAKRLPVRPGILATLEFWSERLAGTDVNPELVRLTKARLVLLALARGTKPDRTPLDFDRVLQFISAGDALRVRPVFEPRTVLLNPPYGTMAAPNDCTWGSGRVSRAGVFVDSILDVVPIGATLACILPDVLRSGSRYGRWRSGIADRAAVKSVLPVGLFDANADVDVFFLVLGRRAAGGQWPSDKLPVERLDKDFEVRVGPVVPHRDPLEGPRVRYLDAHCLPPITSEELSQSRAFNGRTFEPPFVVVRRTSRPRLSNGPRLIVNVIGGQGPVAVENHLLVLKPRAGDLRSCEQLAAYLVSEPISRILDVRAARRHLTVGDLKNLPAMGEQPDPSS